MRYSQDGLNKKIYASDPISNMQKGNKIYYDVDVARVNQYCCQSLMWNQLVCTEHQPHTSLVR